MSFRELVRDATRTAGLALLFAWLSSPEAHASCTLSFTNLAFGTYTGTLLPSTSQVTANCTLLLAYSIGLNAGNGAGATTTLRKMTGPTGTLTYQIFQNSTRTTNWGNSAGDTVSGTGTSSNQIYTAYAQILSGQFATPGNYTDTISSSTQSFTVSASVQATCSISANALAFGTYAGASVTASSSLSVQCTNTTPYTVGLSAGTTSGATVTSRLLAGSGGQTLAYNLFSDSGYTTIWGSTSNAVSGTGTGAVQSLNVRGQIPGGQYVTPGSYTDTITATITY